MSRNIFRIALLSVGAAALAACATNPDGTPDCSKAFNQRQALQMTIVSAQALYEQSIGFCKAGEEGDKCRNIALQVKSLTVTGADLALIALNNRCPL